MTATIAEVREVLDDANEAYIDALDALRLVSDPAASRLLDNLQIVFTQVTSLAAALATTPFDA